MGVEAAFRQVVVAAAGDANEALWRIGESEQRLAFGERDGRVAIAVHDQRTRADRRQLSGGVNAMSSWLSFKSRICSNSIRI